MVRSAILITTRQGGTVLATALSTINKAVQIILSSNNRVTNTGKIFNSATTD
jgi:hypothetical protein